MILELIKFFIYTGLIVIISKYILVTSLRKLAENLNLKPKTVGDIAGYSTSIPELLTIGASSFNGLASASIINVLSSNIINFIQYIIMIFPLIQLGECHPSWRWFVRIFKFVEGNLLNVFGKLGNPLCLP